MANPGSSRRVRPCYPVFVNKCVECWIRSVVKMTVILTLMIETLIQVFVISDDQALDEGQVEPSSSSSEDEDDANLVEQEDTAENIINAVAEGVYLPEYFLERLRKTE